MSWNTTAHIANIANAKPATNPIAAAEPLSFIVASSHDLESHDRRIATIELQWREVVIGDARFRVRIAGCATWGPSDSRMFWEHWYSEANEVERLALESGLVREVEFEWRQSIRAVVRRQE